MTPLLDLKTVTKLRPGDKIVFRLAFAYQQAGELMMLQRSQKKRDLKFNKTSVTTRFALLARERD
jgi:hypothetical protein